MHEMVITKAMLDLALDQAEGRRVTGITLQVGEISSVVPGSVEIFFKHFSKDTLAEGAKLHFEVLPLEMACRDCGEVFDLSPLKGVGPHAKMERAFVQGCRCGGNNLDVVGGIGLELKSIDVDEDSGQAGGGEIGSGHTLGDQPDDLEIR